VRSAPPTSVASCDRRAGHAAHGAHAGRAAAPPGDPSGTLTR
jgi:hypothetical protein